MDDTRFNKLLIAANGALPLGFFIYDAFRGQLGVNPIENFLRTTGVMALVFLIITLAVTPLRRITGWNSVIRYRRMLGLYAFFYACIHLVTYSIFDKGLGLEEIAADVVQRPFIAVGMTAFVLLVPLAATSTNGMVKRLGGRNWVRLHKLTYIAAALGVLHFWMIVKSDIFYPSLFGTVLVVLFAIRAVHRIRAMGRKGGDTGQRRAA